MDDEDDDDEENEFESKLVSNVNCISHVEVKEEVIITEDTSDGESTLSDNEKNSDVKLEECKICCKYRSMFIILKNHECLPESDEKCKYCAEIFEWSACFKKHKDSHQIKKESDHSSDSTASDREENEGKCKVCLKYEFMVPLLKSHICKLNDDQKCSDCSEVLHWMTCFKKHIESHEDILCHKEENFSDSTASDNEEIKKLLSPIEKIQCEKCQICLKYQGMFIILEENHMCDVENPNRNCEKCNEIIQWYRCFDKHKKTHQSLKKKSVGDNGLPSSKILQFGGKFDCGICLKLNSIVTSLVKSHKCADKKLCSVCKEVSYWLSCLKNHKRSETILEISDSEDLEAFKSLGQHIDCAVCSKFRANIVNLSDHVCRQRRGSQKCNFCIEFSFWVKNFKAHEKYHENELSSLRKFLSCSGCGKRFSGEKMLDVHKSYCKSSNFSCDICDRKFVNKFFLKKHKIFQLCRSSAISLNNKNKTCEKAFSNSSDCNNHKYFHDLKLFNCPKKLNDFKSEIF